MHAETLKYRKVSQLNCLENNPRKISEDGFRKLCDSIRINGFWEHRPIAIIERNGQYVVLAGNQRVKACRKLRIREVPTICYHDTTADDEREITLRDNINNGDWDVDILSTEDWNDVDFEFIGINEDWVNTISLQEPEQSEEVNVPSQIDEGETDGGVQDTQNQEEGQPLLLDVLYPSDNDFEIPSLLLEQQAGRLELPFTPWGANSRLKKDVATYHFYVDDYRFEKLWKDPTNLLLSGVRAIVEPNCSLHDQTPTAWGLEKIYKKRWLARHMQEMGVKVYADLNVSHKFARYNMLGIPHGYNAFMTRATDGWMKSLEIDLSIAREISGLDTPNLLVYGGGKTGREFCKEHGLLWITDYINAKQI